MFLYLIALPNLMNKASKLYERAALCHQRAINCVKQTEKEGWFELASIWLILADGMSAKSVQFTIAEEPIELIIEEMISPIAPRPIQSTGRASANAPGQRNARRLLVSALPST